MNGFLSRVLPPALVFLAFLLLWSGLIRFLDIKEYLLPSPLQVLEAMRADAGLLLAATLRTMFATVLGFLVASVVGVLLGSLLGVSRWLERGLYPPTLLLQMVPLIAIAPLFVVWFGFGMRSTPLMPLAQPSWLTSRCRVVDSGSGGF